jgi:hypothetical protein
MARRYQADGALTIFANTCLTNLALAGVPINGIKEYAGHASIVETQKYLKFMPQSVDLAASVSTQLAQLANADHYPNNNPTKKSPINRGKI